MNLNSVFPIVGLAQEIKAEGLTKFELFAAMAMQALVSHPDYQNEPHVVAQTAAQLSEALINVLDPQPYEIGGGLTGRR